MFAPYVCGCTQAPLRADSEARPRPRRGPISVSLGQVEPRRTVPRHGGNCRTTMWPRGSLKAVFLQALLKVASVGGFLLVAAFAVSHVFFLMCIDNPTDLQVPILFVELRAQINRCRREEFSVPCARYAAVSGGWLVMGDMCCAWCVMACMLPVRRWPSYCYCYCQCRSYFHYYYTPCFCHCHYIRVRELRPLISELARCERPCSLWAANFWEILL